VHGRGDKRDELKVGQNWDPGLAGVGQAKDSLQWAYLPPVDQTGERGPCGRVSVNSIVRFQEKVRGQRNLLLERMFHRN